MTLRFTEAALRDLDEIFRFLAVNHPDAYEAFGRRLRRSLARIERWPKSAQAVAQREGVRVVPLIRYPYKVFFREMPDGVEVLHVHHAARQDP
jgi:plasmid stabilization system protein ParE